MTGSDQEGDKSKTLLTRWGIPVGLFLLALAVRLPALAQFLTPDEYLWADRSRNFLIGLLDPAHVCESPTNHTGFEQAVGLACTLRTGHPGVTTMWTGSIGILLRYLADGAPGRLVDYALDFETNPLDPRFIAPLRLPTVVLTSWWVAALYWLVWRLFSDRRVALAAGLLLALDPFHAAFSRVIHHDALATTFMLLSLFTALIYWTHNTSRRWLIVSGALAGLAFLSKSPAFILGPVMALISLWTLLSRWMRGEAPSWWHVARTVGDGLLWFGCAVGVFVALWPAMWVIPLDALRTVFFIGSKYATGGHAKGNYFLGNVSQDPGILFYPVTWLLRSSPLAWIGLVALAVGWVRRQVSKSANQQTPPPPQYPVWSTQVRVGKVAEQRGGGGPGPFGVPPVGVLLLYSVLFVIFMTVGEKKQDRYILSVYPVLNVVAALGLVQVFNIRLQIFNFRLLLVPVILLVQGVLVLVNYPYYLTYYNPLLGGIRGADRVVTIGWGEGLELAAEYLNQKPDAENLRVSAWYESTFAPFFKGEAISYSKEKGKAMAGDYVVFYINQLQRRFPDDELFQYFEARYRPEKLISLKGVDYVAIYPGPGIQHYVEDRVDETRRNYRGIAALLGWDWPGVNDLQPPTVVAGEALPFRLYWEYLGKVPEEEFFFRLVGPEGGIWAEGISRPVLSESGDPESWREGHIVTEEGELNVPPGTPPGQYRLQIGFYTRAPAVPEGELVFDLPAEDARVEVMSSTQVLDPADLPVARRQDVRLAELKLLGARGLDIPLVPDEPWTVEVYWQADSVPVSDYLARFSLVDGDEQTRWIWDPVPPVSFYPTSDWKVGHMVRSQMEVTPTLRTPGGEFDLILTLLDDTGRLAGRASLGSVLVEGRTRSFTAPSIDVPVGATFGDAIELAGFNLESRTANLEPGDEITVTLIWRALAPIEDDYTITVQLLGKDGRVYGQRDAPPLEGVAPTSTWSPGEVVSDSYRFVVAADAPPGEYRLVAAMYLPETGDRLVVEGQGDMVELSQLALQ